MVWGRRVVPQLATEPVEPKTYNDVLHCKSLITCKIQCNRFKLEPQLGGIGRGGGGQHTILYLLVCKVN